MDIRSKLTIGEIPNAPGRWYVDWTELGPVEKDIAQVKLCEIVFDRIRPRWQIGIGYNVQCFRPTNPEILWPGTKIRDPNDPVSEETFKLEEFTKWEVLWISFDGWMHLRDSDYDSFAQHLFHNGTPRKIATGIILETLDQAEQFVDLIEAQYTFYRLKQDYSGDYVYFPG